MLRREKQNTIRHVSAVAVCHDSFWVIKEEKASPNISSTAKVLSAIDERAFQKHSFL
jgi:hypothetical protein